MSNKRKVRSYGQRARDVFPAYAVAGAPCDAQACDQPVAGDRTITLVREHRKDDLSVLVRLCKRHVDMPYAELLPLLPALNDLVSEAGRPPYFGEPS